MEPDMDTLDKPIKINKKVSFNKNIITNIKHYEVERIKPYKYKFKTERTKRILLKFAKSELEYLRNKNK